MIQKIAAAPLGAKKMGRLGERRDSLPWRVQLMVRPSMLEELKPVIYYVRGADPNKVCMMASKLWLKWEKFDLGLIDAKYPDVEEFGFAECIDNQDFKEAYRDAVKHKLKRAVAGDPKDPSAFTIFNRTDI